MDAPGTLLSRAPEVSGGINNSVVVDDMKITNEKYAWGLVSETLAKHHLQRTEEELSRCMTLFLRLKAISDLSENDCMPKFTARLQMVKSARMLSVGPGVVLLSKGKEGDSETVIPHHEGGEDVGAGGGSTRTASGFLRPQPPPTQQQKGGGNNNNNNNGVYLPDIRKTNSSLFAGGSNKNNHSNNTNINNSGGRSSPPRGELTKKGSALQLMHSGGSAVLTSSVAMVGDYGLSSVGDEGNAGDTDSHDGENNSVNKMFYMIVEGDVALERPTINGRVRTEVHTGEAIGSSLTMNALPPGSFYLTLSQTKLLAIPWLIYTQFMRDFDENEIRNRIHFFQEKVVVPVLTPFPEARFRWLARCCYQVHLRPKEIAVREGDLSDCVFFILSGKMKVIRAIDFSPSMTGASTMTTTAGSDLHHTHSSNGNPFGSSVTTTSMATTMNATNGGGSSPAALTATVAPSLSSSTSATASSNVKLLDLATLESGEYFGELGILRRCVDQSVACSLNDLLTITTEDIATIDNEREVTKIDALIASIPRQATVYADTPASLLVIPRARFIELVQQGALVRFREYAKGYPSATAIRNHFVREHRWNVYKTKVYADDHTR